MEQSKPTNKKANTTTMIVGGLGLIGVSVLGVSLASKNAETANTTNVQAQTESVINLPATNEKVNGLESRHDTDIKALNDQINRREVEMRNERDKLLQQRDNTIVDLRDRIKRLEDITYLEAKEK